MPPTAMTRFSGFYDNQINCTVHPNDFTLANLPQKRIDDLLANDNELMQNNHRYLQNTDGSFNTQLVGHNEYPAVVNGYSLPFPIAMTLLTVGSFIFAFGVFGNLMIMGAVFISRKLRRPYNVFIFSFAITDLTILLGVGVFQVYFTTYDNSM